MKKIMMGILTIALLGLAACSSGAEEETGTDANTVDVNTIALDTGVSSVSAEGRIVPLDDAEVAFQIGGELAEILLSEGEIASAGDPLLRLVDTDQQISLKQAQAAVVQAEANVESSNAAMVSAEAGLQAAQVGVEAAEANLALVESGATAEQIALTEAQVGTAEAGIIQASGQQAATLEGATSAQIQAAEAQVIAAEAAVVPAQLNRDTILRDGGSNEAKNQAQLELNAAIANVEAAQAALSDLRAGATSGQRQAVAGGVASAAASRDASQAQLDLLLSGSRAEEVVVAQVGVDQALNAVSEAELSIQQAAAGLAQAESALAEAQKAVEAAESALAKTVIYAPISGTVAQVMPKVGEVIVAGGPVVTLADFSQWHIETTDLTELNVVSIANGFSADVEIDAFPGETLSGTVTDIATTSDLVLGDVTYRVTLELNDDNGLPLRWGMTSFVTIDVEQ